MNSWRTIVRSEIFKRKSSKRHELRIRGRGAHYIYHFDLGPGLDIEKFAAVLLDKNLATIAATPRSDDLRVSKSLVKAEKSRETAENFYRFVSELASDSPNLARMIRAQPLLGIRVATAYIIHLILSPFRTSRNGRINPAREDVESRPFDEIMSMAEDAMTKTRESMLSYHVHGALRVRMDQDVYFARYFENDPYIRLELNRSFFSELGSSDELAVSASLLVHATGVCLLTLSSDVEEELDFAGIKRLTVSSWRRLDAMKVALPIVAAAEGLSGRREKSLEGLLEAAENTYWLPVGPEMVEDGKLTMHSVFESYFEALYRLSNSRRPVHWGCFTVLSLGEPLCGCPASACKQSHHREFSELAFRTSPGVRLQDRVASEVVDNVLSIQGLDLMLSAGNAIYVNWESDGPDFLEDVRVALAPIESAILQDCELRQVDEITSNAVVRDSKLFEAQKILATGLQEYRRSLLSGPDHQVVVESLLAKRRVPDLYEQLIDRVELLESLASSRYSRVQNRRQLTVASAGFLVVVLVLIPQLSDLLTTLSGIEGWPRSLVERFDKAAGSRGAALLWAYSIVLTTTALVLLIFARTWRLPRRKRRYGRSLRRAYAVNFVAADEGVVGNEGNPTTPSNEIPSQVPSTPL